MMKRLLFCALSALFAFSANAVEKGDYVYTPQGRFLITGETNLMGNAGSFANLDAWSVATADTTGVRTLADNFTVGTDGDVAYAQSLVNTVGEGMKFTSNSLDASGIYVVAYKMRNAVETAPVKPLTTATNATHAGAGNLVTFTGTYTDPETSAADVVTYNKAAEISTEWITYCYAIVGDGKTRVFDISLTAMNTNVQIADIQILEAQQVADDRDAKAKAEYIKSIYDLTDWSKFDDETQEIYPAEDLIMAYGQVATITDEMKSYLIESAALSEEEIASFCPGFTEDLDTYKKQLQTYDEKYANFMKTQMTAYIDVTKETGEHLGQNSGNNQKINPIGTWEVVSPSGRGYWRYGWVDLGHYAGSANFETAELKKEFTLFEGGYTFKADFVGVSRPTTGSGDWNTNYGLTSDDAFVFVTDAEDNIIATSDTTGTATDIDGEWTTKYVTFSVPADGKYTMHMKAIRRYTTNGGQVYFRWPELYGRSFGKYSADEKIYIDAVQGQIAAGDNAYQEALDNIASDLEWGKVELQACVDTMTAKKETFDAVYNDEDAIVETYDKDTYVSDPTKPESQMVYEVYTEYVKDLLAANRRFTAVNDTLNMLPAKINDAEKLNALSIYQVSLGKDSLLTEISKAKEVDAAMRAVDYSEENAQIIKDEIAALEAAMEYCKNNMDSTKFTKVYADIDFEYTSELYDNLDYTDEMQPATIHGKVGALEVPQFKKENVVTASNGTASEFPYQLGIDIEAQRQYAGVLRAGCSDATVSFNASDLGQSILLVSMDWWFSKLGDLYSGFEVLDEDANVIAGFVVCSNDNKANTNTFNIDPVNQFYNAINKNDAEVLVDAYHSQWTAVLDFANGKQYLIGKVNKKTVISDPVEMNVTGVPATFKLAGSIGKNKYPGRRNWFDNLKIQKVEITPSPAIKGDVNGDGIVNGTDIQAVINFIVAGEYDAKADVNEDGKVNGTDIQEIINIIVSQD